MIWRTHFLAALPTLVALAAPTLAGAQDQSFFIRADGSGPPPSGQALCMDMTTRDLIKKNQVFVAATWMVRKGTAGIGVQVGPLSKSGAPSPIRLGSATAVEGCTVLSQRPKPNGFSGIMVAPDENAKALVLELPWTCSPNSDRFWIRVKLPKGTLNTETKLIADLLSSWPEETKPAKKKARAKH
jgi:hypothetical protein